MMIDEAFEYISVDRSKKPHIVVIWDRRDPPGPNVFGTIDESDELRHHGIVRFPPPRGTQDFFYYPKEAKIYWDNSKGKSQDVWVGQRSKINVSKSNNQGNNGNYRFVNQLCAYQKYNNIVHTKSIPELLTFLSKLESIEARWFILDKNLGMLLYFWYEYEMIILAVGVFEIWAMPLKMREGPVKF